MTLQFFWESPQVQGNLQRQWPGGHGKVRLAHHIRSQHLDHIDLEDLVELYDDWGLPGSEKMTLKLFGNADLDGDGKIDYREFKEEMMFVWEWIYDVGETNVTSDGKYELNCQRNGKIKHRSLDKKKREEERKKAEKVLRVRDDM
jgi:hypothetical protein